METKFKHLKYLQTGVYCFAFVLLGCSLSSIGPTLPTLATNLGTKPERLGYLFTARSSAYMLGSYVGGKAIDRIAGHRILLLSACTLVCGLVWIPFCRSVATMVLAFIVLGFSMAGLDVCSNTLLGWVWGAHVASWLQFLHFSFGVGSFLIPMWVALLITLSPNGVTLSYISMAVFCPLVAGLAALVPSPDPPSRHPEAHVDANSSSGTPQGPGELANVEVVMSEEKPHLPPPPTARNSPPLAKLQPESEPGHQSRHAGSNDSERGDAYLLEEAWGRSDGETGDVTVGRGEVGKGRERLSVILLTAVFLCMYVGAEMTFGGWVTTYVLLQGIGSEQDGAFLTAMFWLATTIGRLAGIPVAWVLTSEQVLAIDLIGSMLSVVVCLVLQHSLVALWLSTLFTGLFMASAFATALTLPSQMHKGELRGKEMGILLMGAALGSWWVPFVVGTCFTYLGPLAFQFVLLIDCAVSLVLLVVITRIVPLCSAWANRTAQQKLTSTSSSSALPGATESPLAVFELNVPTTKGLGTTQRIETLHPRPFSGRQMPAHL